jgi:hypothetical protein
MTGHLQGESQKKQVEKFWKRGFLRWPEILIGPQLTVLGNDMNA